MAPPKAVGSLKTEGGLQKLNELLADRSFVGGNTSATQEDFDRFVEIQRLPDKQLFPHVLRWHRQIAALRARHPEGYPGASAAGGAEEPAAAAKKGRPAGKEKQPLIVDCEPTPVKDKKVPDPSVVAGGAGAKCMPGTSDGKSGRFYVTTAINYANGWPHIGHAYEALTSDAFARHHRMLGKDVFFQTGADEHGQKIAQQAEKEDMTPIALCDRYCEGFKALNQRLNVSSDFYVRTTGAAHEEVARAMWNKCKAAGDIYLDRYEGWYLVREERFIPDAEAQEWNFKDPLTGLDLKKCSEPSFFFRMSKYRDAVLKHIEDNEDFVQPAQYRGEILERMRGIEMRDLSISRGTFDWGVPCPEDAVDGKPHVMYVWFDALINYMSGVNATDKSKPLSRFWPCQMHVIGKDISWFHAVIWPSMLMSAGMPLPKSIVVHGMISGSDGRKMSKSLGNVVDPHDLLDRLPCDTVRWYLCREAPFGDDLKFSEESMRLMHNADLCDNLGNLVNRAVALSGGSVPSCDLSLVKTPFNLKDLKKATVTAFENSKLSEGADLALQACRSTNKWIAELEPWKMKAPEQQATRIAAIRVLIEAVYVLAHFFAPYIPTAAEAIFKKIGTQPVPILKLKDDFNNLKEGSTVASSSVLFAVMDTKVQPLSPAASPTAKAEPKGKAKAEAKGKAKAEPQGGAKAKAKAEGKKGGKKQLVEENPDQPLFSKLDVRVGRITKAWNHPEADRLFCEEIDVGEAEPRQIVSGLREHYKLEEFQGRKLLVVCNMQPAKMRGVTSYGMVLCAKRPEANKVELIDVPEGCAIGTRLLPEGVPATWEPLEPAAVKEYKVWERVAEQLKTADDRTACFDGKPLTTADGTRFLAPSLGGSMIS